MNSCFKIILVQSTGERIFASGLHAFLILWIMKGAAKGRFHAHYYLPVDLVGLYWHLVDLIWIFLFPLLYLVP